VTRLVAAKVADLTENREIYIPHVYSTPPWGIRRNFTKSINFSTEKLD